jgi:hypothetical protein
MVNLEDLKNVWQSEGGISQQRFDQIGSRVKESSERLHATILRRDVRETFASVVVVVVFSCLMFSAKSWVDRLGYVIIAIGGITIPFVLWRARSRSLATISTATFRDFVNVEIDYLHRQVRLLRSVTWWYLLPFYMGLALVLVGLMGPRYSLGDLILLCVCLAVIAGLYVYIWWLNQTARKTDLEPLLNYYLEMRTALDSGDERDVQ